MRIALVHQRHATVGGTERFMNALARHLAEAGHQVEIVCRRHAGAPHPAVRFRVLHGFALGTTWRLWRFAKDVEAAIRPGEYDVVLGLGKTWTHDVVRAGGGCHATYVEHAHRWVRRPWERMLGVGRLKNRVALAIEARTYGAPGLRAVVTNSEMVKRDIALRHGVAPDAITVIRNGVDLRRFHPGRRGAEGARLRRPSR